MYFVVVCLFVFVCFLYMSIGKSKQNKILLSKMFKYLPYLYIYIYIYIYIGICMCMYVCMYI